MFVKFEILEVSKKSNIVINLLDISTIKEIQGHISKYIEIQMSNGEKYKLYNYSLLEFQKEVDQVGVLIHGLDREEK